MFSLPTGFPSPPIPNHRPQSGWRSPRALSAVAGRKIGVEDDYHATLRALNSGGRRHNPRKSLGQHYMLNSDINEQLAAVTEIEDGDVVLEIGPGTGSLTNVLITSGASVIAIEKDPHMVDLMEERFGCTDQLLVNSAFNGKSKMLRKSLQHLCPSHEIESALSSAGLPVTTRPEELTVDDFNYIIHEAVLQLVSSAKEVFLSVMNVITSMLWGGLMEAGSERNTVGSDFRELVAEITELLGKPNVSDFFPRLARFDLQGLDKKMRVLCARFDRMFDKMIDQRKKMNAEGGGNDFLDFMLRMESEEAHDSATPFTMTHVKALLMDMVIGGTDTTSNTIEFAMAEMMNKPDTMKRAQEELDQEVGRNNTVEESHIPRLRYLSLVIKEVLRLHPTLPLLVPHCPSSSSTIGGYTIPQGSRVFVNVWAIHRDPSVWDDPLEFKPERFLSASSKLDYSGNNFDYFPFGSGRRICAGIAMAERMTSFSLASLLHSFDWKVEEGMKIDLEEKFGIVLKKARPLVAIPTPRLDGLELYS